MNQYERALLQVLKQYPVLAQSPWGIFPKTDQVRKGQLEFFHPDEPSSPAPGIPSIEIYNPDLKGDYLESAIFGDMLHYAPEISPEFANLKKEFLDSRTREQHMVDNIAYHASKYRGEKRPFDWWFDVSRGDAHIRGLLAPDERNEWARSYTPKQREIGKKMKGLLQGG